MTDIIASPAVKEAVKVVMEQQERLGDEAAAEALAGRRVGAHLAQAHVHGALSVSYTHLTLPTIA